MTRTKSFSFYGQGIPSVNVSDLTGKLIVLEGPAGSGRSTPLSTRRK